MSLRGQRVVVTGAARGIGRAIATELAAAGLEVVVADLDGALAEQVADELVARGQRAEPRAIDVTSAAGFAGLVETIERERGPIDVLINNAGVMSLGGFLDQPASRDALQMQVNVDGIVNGLRAVLPPMLARRRGHVVNIASVAGRVGAPYAAVYSATKFAVIGLTEAVRAELEGRGVDFTYVMPSLVRTELIAGAGQPAWPPVASPQDVARAVHRALRTKQVDVYVPRSARLSVILPALLPRAIYERVGRWLKVDRMFAAVDEGARAAYVARIERSAPSRSRGDPATDPVRVLPARGDGER